MQDGWCNGECVMYLLIASMARTVDRQTRTEAPRSVGGMENAPVECDIAMPSVEWICGCCQRNAELGAEPKFIGEM